MVMILLSQVLEHRLNRPVNIFVAIVLTSIAAVSLFDRTPTPVYAVISVISLVTGLAIIWLLMLEKVA
jgi:hypothetical protein